MSKVDRLHQYESLPSSRRIVSAQDLSAALEVSRTIVKHDIAKFCRQVDVPITYRREAVCVNEI